MAYRVHDSRRKFGVESGPFTGQRTIDLRRLPDGARDALRERLERGKPRPILTKTGSLERLVAVALVLAGGAGATWVAKEGFGDLAQDSQLALPWAAPYVAAAMVVALGIAVFARSVRRDGFVRFPQGTLVYPLDLLQIEGRRVRIRSFGDARYVDAEGSALTIEYGDGEKISLRGRRHSQASLLTEMIAAQHDLEDATAAEKSTQDVLGELRAHFPWDELAPEGPAPKGGFSILAGAALVGAALGFAGWELRCVLEDDALFATARARDSESAYLTYLANGTRHRTEAREDLAEAARQHANGKVVELARVTTEFAGTNAATVALRDLHRACTDYARIETRERCALRDAAGKCTLEQEEERLCAAEVVAADDDRILHSNSLLAIFAERARKAEAKNDASVKLIDEHVQTLVELADNQVCAVDAPAADVRALHALALREHRLATMKIIIRGDPTWLREALWWVRHEPIDLTMLVVEKAPLEPSNADATWSFEVGEKEIVWTSASGAVARAPIVRPSGKVEPVPSPEGMAELGALERLGFRPDTTHARRGTDGAGAGAGATLGTGGGASRCAVPALFRSPPSRHP